MVTYADGRKSSCSAYTGDDGSNCLQRTFDDKECKGSWVWGSDQASTVVWQPWNLDNLSDNTNHAMFHQRDDVPYHRYWTLCYIHGKSNSWIRIPWRDCIRCSYHLLWWEESSCPRLQVQRWWSGDEVDQWTWPWFGNREVPLEIFSTQECRKDPQGRQRDDGVPWPISVSLSIWGCNPTC